ncbi:molybdate transport system regulatory protein [Desulfarculales bacterium]
MALFKQRPSKLAKCSHVGSKLWPVRAGKAGPRLRIQYKLWLEQDGRVLFGQGRQELLAAVVETGSLAGAAQKMSMSYRAAWGRIKASEERLGFPLVEHSGQRRRSTKPTPEALQLLRWFGDMEARAEAALRQALEEVPECLCGPGQLAPPPSKES